MTLGGKPKTVKPPALPPPVATPVEISAEAAKVGQAEKKLLRGRRGRLSTMYTTPGFMAPAQIGRAGLKQKLG